MASQLSPIPKTAPFAEEEIDLLNRVVGIANPIQRAWLAGFLAGLDAQAGAHARPEPAAPPRAAEPLTIVYASESGNSERLAADMAKLARKRGLKPTVVDMADLDLADLAKSRRLVVIAATWGEGEPPGRAAASYAALMGDGAPRLDGVEFAVLALGDTAYVEFCAIGKAIDARLEALGGKRVADRADLDLDFAAPAARWIDGAAHGAGAGRGGAPRADRSSRSISAPRPSPISGRSRPRSPPISISTRRAPTRRRSISSSPSTARRRPTIRATRSISIRRTIRTTWSSCSRRRASPSDGALREEFIKDRDVTTLSLKTVESYAAATGHQYVKALIESGEARDWIAGRQLIDLIAHFPIALTAEQLRALTRPLAPRAYSIASSRREVGDEAHLLVSAVRYASHGRDRKGVASSYVADRLKKGARVRVKLRPNKHFALPASDRDIIMVGPGTGIAPFRAFVQERRAAGATGKSWLFFGDRNYTHDFLYQLEWQDALKDGALTRMDVAFSRDTPEKVYVQNRIWDRRRDVVDWLDNGASFYVCGDAKQMAKDVRATLVRAYADVKALAPDARRAGGR